MSSTPAAARAMLELCTEGSTPHNICSASSRPLGSRSPPKGRWCLVELWLCETEGCQPSRIAFFMPPVGGSELFHSPLPP
eukprot:9258749-Karenia_brevis.AAC.2